MTQRRRIAKIRHGWAFGILLVFVSLAFALSPVSSSSRIHAGLPDDRPERVRRTVMRASYQADDPVGLSDPRAGSGAESDEPGEGTSPQSAPKAVADFEGIPGAGQTIRLNAGRSSGEGLRFRWTQTSGPKAVLADSNVATTELIVPEAAEELGFLLVVANREGIDSTPLKIPVPSARPSAGDPANETAVDLATLSPTSPAGRLTKAVSIPPTADAGDDQIAIVGRQVTLNGGRSEPRGEIGYRWIQVGGPSTRLTIEENHIFSFVPTVPGIYRYALVVASGRAISKPDVVSVTVAAPTATAAAVPESSPGAPLPMQTLASKGLTSVKGGVDSAEILSETFDTLADRMDLYQSYSEMFSEMSRRLDQIVPSDPAWRNLWMERIFTPMTGRLVEALIPEGLDLRRPEAQNAELTAGQRARLAEQFREIAEGFRATKPPR